MPAAIVATTAVATTAHAVTIAAVVAAATVADAVAVAADSAIAAHVEMVEIPRSAAHLKSAIAGRMQNPAG